MRGEGVDIKRKTLGLLLIALAFTVYTITVHGLADRHLYEDPVSTIVYWTSGPSGSLFPWPNAPGLLEIITQANEVDAFIYQYLLKTQALAGLSLLLWAMTGLCVFRRKDVPPAETLRCQGRTNEELASQRSR